MKKEKILVVKKDILFPTKDDYFNGFRNAQEGDFENRILKYREFLDREIAETCQVYKQPIGYCSVADIRTKQIFAYKRASKDDKYKEKRLQGKWSWGIGGHIEKSDITENPIRESIKREIEEEIVIEGHIKDILPIGYINDDSNDVGKVHFGILYVALVEPCKKIVPVKNYEIEKGSLMPIKKLEEMCNSNMNIETWSKISLYPIKSFLEKY